MPSRRSKRTTRHSERMSRHGVRCPAPPRSLPKSRKSIRRRFFNEPKHEGWKIRRHEKQDARFAEHKPELSEIQLSNRLIMNKKSLIRTISQELDPPVSVRTESPGFSTKGSSSNPRTAHGSFPLPVFHRHFLPPEITRHRSPME